MKSLLFYRACSLLVVLPFHSVLNPISATTCGDSLRILIHYHGTETNTYAGVKIGLLGDVNSDGFSDIAISQLGDMRGTNVVYGGNPADSLSDQFIRGYIQGIVDLNGDDIGDVVTSFVRDQPTTPPGVVYFFRGFADSLATLPYDSMLVPAEVGFGIGVPVTVGYADNDSLGDLLVSHEYRSEGPALFFYSGSPSLDTTVDWTHAIINASHNFRGFGFIDFNGDGNQDIFIGMHADLDSIGYVYIFLGPGYKSAPDVVISPPTDLTGYAKDFFADGVFKVGDIDGDKWGDLGVLYGNQALVYFCGTAGDANYDLILSGRARTMANAGDVSGDGFNDIICGQTRTADGAVDIYLGGPALDAYYDCSIYRSELPPALLQDIGYNVSSAGDFNGDGVGDFMFSCRNFAGGLPGDVFVIAGSNGIVTDVADDLTSAPLPHLRLFQNYPNPFNPITNIGYEIYREGLVDIRIINMTGQVVRVLIHERQSPADRTVTWDGRNDRGQLIASGRYFCRISLDDEYVSIMMLFIK